MKYVFIFFLSFVVVFFGINPVAFRIHNGQTLVDFGHSEVSGFNEGVNKKQFKLEKNMV